MNIDLVAGVFGRTMGRQIREATAAQQQAERQAATTIGPLDVARPTYRYSAVNAARRF